MEKLLAGEASDTLTLKKTLDSINEGSPTFESVEFTNSLRESTITLLYEYQDILRKTHLAKGKMTPNPDAEEPNWETFPVHVDKVFESAGLLTSFGSRSKFNYEGTDYYLAETSRYNYEKNDLETHIAICNEDLVPLALLPFQLPEGASD